LAAERIATDVRRAFTVIRTTRAPATSTCFPTAWCRSSRPRSPAVSSAAGAATC
jgi:hypothetical protein